MDDGLGTLVARRTGLQAPGNFRKEPTHIIKANSFVLPAALERTFLAWQRTSLAFANLAVMIAQLFRLSLPGSSHPYIVRLHDFGIPLSSTCVVISIVLSVSGMLRFWRQQSAMVHRRKIHVSGWEIYMTGLLALLVRVKHPSIQER